MFTDIIEFHQRFELNAPDVPQLLDKDTADFRIDFMQEELHEFINAHNAGDLVKAADALADLTYVVLGTAYLMGLPFNDVWDSVHRANMTKVRAQSADESKRGSQLDVVKPEGFVPPDESIRMLLQDWGAKV
jgi:predicted HAD superfamily Cof-like phosphohydrolase